MLWFLRCFILPFSEVSSKLQDIEEGNHDDKECEEYCKRYTYWFGKELPNCQFKSNKSQIQNLIRKVKIDANGRLIERKRNENAGGSDTKVQLSEKALDKKKECDANGDQIFDVAAAGGNFAELLASDKEIQTSVISNIVQQMLSMRFDDNLAPVIGSILEINGHISDGKRISKYGQPSNLVLRTLDAETRQHLKSFIEEFLSSKQSDSTERKRNEKITKLVNFMNRHILKWTNTVVQSRDSNIDFKPLWLDIETFLAYVEANFTSQDDSKDVTLIFWENIEPAVEKFCKNLGWNCSPAALITEEIISVVIIYDHDDFHFDTFVRAKDRLIIVTKSTKM